MSRADPDRAGSARLPEAEESKTLTSPESATREGDHEAAVQQLPTAGADTGRAAVKTPEDEDRTQPAKRPRRLRRHKACRQPPVRRKATSDDTDAVASRPQLASEGLNSNDLYSDEDRPRPAKRPRRLRKHKGCNCRQPPVRRKVISDDTDAELRAAEAKDRLRAEEAQNRLRAADAKDRLRAREEKDRLRAEEAQNRLRAKEEKDRLRAEEAQNRLRAEETKDRLRAEEAKDRLRAEKEKDRLRADEAQNRLRAADAKDRLRAKEEKDRLRAEEAEDRLTAEEAEDRLADEEAEDRLTDEEAGGRLRAEEAEDRLRVEEAKDRLRAAVAAFSCMLKQKRLERQERSSASYRTAVSGRAVTGR